MKLHKVVLSAVAAFALAATSASAGGRGSLKDDGRPFSWTGFYVGGHVGAAVSDIDWLFTSAGTSANHDGDGMVGGAQVGYNWQTGALVFGVEADISASSIEGNRLCPNTAFSCAHEVNWLASVRGRIGVAFNAHRTMLYGTGGVAWADIDYSTTFLATGGSGGTNTGTFSKTHTGWVAGGGIEHSFASNWSARLEYLYYSFDDASAPNGTLTVVSGPSLLEPTAQVVRAGINFKY